MLTPTTPTEACDAIADALRDGRKIDIRGGGSKASIGAARPAATLLSTAGFSGVVDYDPAELVLTVGAGTPLADIEALVAGQNQMLAFEPFDHTAILGGTNSGATIGGVVAAGVAGSRRLSMGSARDHLLGFVGVSGRGDQFVAGAKVVKNVTGYDLPKLLAGSWGRLALMTEITLKVLPRPRVEATLAMRGLSPAEAQTAMSTAMGSPAEVSAAAHLPDFKGGITMLRLHGFPASVDARCALLRDLLGAEQLDDGDARRLWEAVRDLSSLAGPAPLWRVCVPPSGGPAVVAALAPLGARWLFDWAGGLVWIAVEADAVAVRSAAATAGGHAMLARAPLEMRMRVPAIHPRTHGVAALEARVRHAFDPMAVFETGRFLDMTDAD